MRKATVILLILALAVAAPARLKRSKPAWFRNLKGWHKILGLVAVLLAVGVILNPDLLALGLLGDSAFFDMLILALSVQMLVAVQWAWHNLRAGCVKSIRWFGIPSPGFRYLMCVSTLAIVSATAAVQKVVHRISS